MKERIEIRPMKVDDLREIYLLGHKAFGDHWSPLQPAWNEATLADVMAGDGLCLVAASKKSIDGFIIVSLEESGGHACAVIRWLCTRENKPAGLLTDMLHTLKSTLVERKIEKIIVSIPVENTELIEYYRNFGFTESNRFIIMENFSPEKS
jgi:ribosomal protein S18 acetylase RimI-like enzyme